MIGIRERLILLLGILLLVGGFAAAKDQAPGSGTTGRLSILVFAHFGERGVISSRPVGYVEIEVSSGLHSFTRLTDVDGRLDLTDLLPGRYGMVARLDGWSNVEYPHVVIEPGRTTTIEIELSKSRPKPDLVSVCDVPEDYLERTPDFVRERYALHCAAIARGAAASYRTLLDGAQEQDWLPRAAEAGFEGYRFLWIRSFDEPVVITLERPAAATPAVSIKRFDGPGSHDYGNVRTTRQRLASPAELSELRALADDLGFWSEAPVVVRPGWGCLDGATWIIEAVRDGDYHYVDRHCPESDSVVLPLGKRLMVLSGEAFDRVY